jgi:hypothetical protein
MTRGEIIQSSTELNASGQRRTWRARARGRAIPLARENGTGDAGGGVRVQRGLMPRGWRRGNGESGASVGHAMHGPTGGWRRVEAGWKRDGSVGAEAGGLPQRRTRRKSLAHPYPPPTSPSSSCGLASLRGDCSHS